MGEAAAGGAVVGEGVVGEGVVGESVVPGVRRAGPADVPVLVRLRAVMFEDMGIPAGGEDAEWRVAAAAWFGDGLTRAGIFAAFVVEDPGAGVVSAACGICDVRPPGPRGLSPVRGAVFGVATDPAHRRRGHARACLEALLGWFTDETTAEVVELTASPDGADLYESLGFRRRGHPVMRRGLRGATEAFL